MSAGKDTGGPAFPESLTAAGPFGGMSLRDYFAGQVLAGIGSRLADADKTSDDIAENVALLSYVLADAMLLERSKP